MSTYGIAGMKGICVDLGNVAGVTNASNAGPRSNRCHTERKSKIRREGGGKVSDGGRKCEAVEHKKKKKEAANASGGGLLLRQVWER